MSGEEIQTPEEQISREVLQLHHETYGTGATAAHVHLMGDFVLVALDVELTRSEETLIDAERPDAVTAMRESFQQAVAARFKAIIERATGRRVTSFLSRMSVDPLYSIEVFRLEPQHAHAEAKADAHGQ